MDENKNYNEPEEVTEEEVEETTEAAEEDTEEIAEAVEAEATETTEETEEAAPTAEIIPEEPEAVKKGSKIGAIIAVVIAIVVIAAAVITSNMEFNKYNKMGYVDISGQTVQDLADSQGITLEEFLQAYSLPADMPADTTEAAAYYNIPVERIAEMYGMDFETLKATLHLGEEVTAETAWGEAEGGIILSDYVGAENIETFKAQYQLGDEVTGDTKWKDLRNIVDEAQKKLREAQEKTTNNGTNAETDAAEDTNGETEE